MISIDRARSEDVSLFKSNLENNYIILLGQQFGNFIGKPIVFQDFLNQMVEVLGITIGRRSNGETS